MSDYQVTNYGMCGECRHHKKSEAVKDWICCNEDSDYCGCYTQYTDTCEEWEQRGID